MAAGSVTVTTGQGTVVPMAEGKQVYVRMDADLLKRIAARQRKQSEKAGVELSTSAIVKLAIERGLDALDSEDARKK